MQVGASLHPRNVLRMLSNLVDVAELPRLRFRDLRRSAASLLMLGFNAGTIYRWTKEGAFPAQIRIGSATS